jgi:hypothetical protein
MLQAMYFTILQCSSTSITTLAWGGDGATSPAAYRSELGLFGSNLLQVGDGELRESRIGRGWEAGAAMGNSSCRRWPAVAGVGEEMASRRLKSTGGWRSAGGGRSPTLVRS